MIPFIELSRFGSTNEDKKRYKEIFVSLGLPEEYADLYYNWVDSGVFVSHRSDQRQYLKMFEDLASVLPANFRTVTQPVIYRGLHIPIKKCKPAIQQWANNGKVKHSNVILASWTTQLSEATWYTRPSSPNEVGILLKAPPKNIVLSIDKFLRKEFDKVSNEYVQHANDYEVVVKGNPVPFYTRENVVSLIYKNKVFKGPTSASKLLMYMGG